MPCRLSMPPAQRGASSSETSRGYARRTKPSPTTLYADLSLEAGAKFPFPADHEERAIYILSGSLEVAGDIFACDQLLAFRAATILR